MFKLYLRTLVKSIKYAAIFLGVFFIGGMLVLVTLANFFKNIPFVPTLILLGVPTFVAFAVSLRVRKNDRDIAKVYRNASGTFHLRVGEDLKRMFYTKEFWAELLVFCTYAAALCLVGGRIIFSNVLEGILLVIGSVILFIILNAASWLIVHKAYLKDKIV